MHNFFTVVLWIAFFGLCVFFLWTFNPISQFGLRMIDKFENWVKNSTSTWSWSSIYKFGPKMFDKLKTWVKSLKS